MPRRTYYCKLCNDSKVATTTEKFSEHLLSSHNVDILDYYTKYPDNIPFRIKRRLLYKDSIILDKKVASKIEYNNIDEDGNLECPICHNKYKVLTRHISKSHRLDVEQFKKDYPSCKMVSDKTSSAISKTLSSTLYRLWKDKDYREAQTNRVKEARNNPNSKMCQRLMEVAGRRRYKYVNHKKTKVFNFRSSWEVQFARYLDDHNEDIEFESFAIRYEYGMYYPDFYISKLNLIVEVKPSNLIDDDVVQAKKLAAENLGYKFKFLTEDDISNLEEFLPM